MSKQDEFLEGYLMQVEESLLKFPTVFCEFTEIWKRNRLGAYGFLNDFFSSQPEGMPEKLKALDEEIFWTLY